MKIRKNLIRILSIVFAAALSLGVLTACPPPGDPTVTSIKMSKSPVKTVYLVGENFLDLEGGSILATFSDGNVNSFSLTDPEVDVDTTAFKTDVAKKITLTVTFREKTCTFDITVRDTVVKSISMSKLPKTEYEIGDAFNPNGGTISLLLEDNETSTVALSAAETEGFDSSEIGEVTITVTYKGKTCTFKVEIKEEVIIQRVPEPAGYGNGKKKAPDFTLTDVNGNTVSLSDFYGIKPVFMTFWGWSCNPCLREMPGFNNLYIKMLGEFEILAVHIWDRADLDNLLKTTKFAFPILDDEAQTAYRMGYATGTVPANYMVDMWGYLYKANLSSANITDYSLGLLPNYQNLETIVRGAMTRAELALA